MLFSREFGDFESVRICLHISFLKLDLYLKSVVLKDKTVLASKYFDVNKINQYDSDEVLETFENFKQSLKRKEYKLYIKKLKYRMVNNDEEKELIKIIDKEPSLEDFYALDALRVHDAQLNNKVCKIDSLGNLLVDGFCLDNQMVYNDNLNQNIAQKELEGLDEYY